MRIALRVDSVEVPFRKLLFDTKNDEALGNNNRMRLKHSMISMDVRTDQDSNRSELIYVPNKNHA